MASPDDVLHDLIDSIEDLGVGASERIRREVLARLNLLRLADPSDIEYDRLVALAIMQIVDGSVLEAHAQGIVTSGELVGASPVGTGGVGPIFEPQRIAAASRIEGDVMALGDRLDRFLNQSIASGMSIERTIEVLEADLEALGPRVFGDFTRSVDGTLSASIGGAAQAGQIEEQVRLLGGGLDDIPAFDFTWVCALIRTCPDCLPRNAQVRSFEAWRVDGLPRTGWSVCTDHCKCQLAATEVLDRDEIIEPLLRTRRGLSRGTPRGLTVRIPRGMTSAEPSTIEGRQRRIQTMRDQFNSNIEFRRGVRELGKANA